jgi:hypothetical protein
MNTRSLTTCALALGLSAFGLVLVPSAAAEAECMPGGPPPGAATRDVSAVYGSPATLWITDDSTVGITTPEGTGSVVVRTASPLRQGALLIDAQQDGGHQIIVDTGRDAHLYTVSGCTIRTVVDERGAPFLFDEGHRRDTGDGVGCGDLGSGPHLVAFRYLSGDDRGGDPIMMRRTQIDLNGIMATAGPSDTVPRDTDLSCGGLIMQRDGVSAPS